MKRKGINFNISKTLTFFTPTPEQIADLQEQGFLPKQEIYAGYVIPAKLVPDKPNQKLPANSLETRRKWNTTLNPVMVTPIQVTGWSRTNMPYVRIGGKEKVLWVEDGRVYSAPL